MNKIWLYKHIISNISREVKNILNEEILNFNPADYEDDADIIDHNDISKHVYSYFPKTKLQLLRLIKKRITENPKEPYLLDIDTSHITSMSHLFSRFELSENENIEILDLSTWNTSNVKNMTRMFYGCMSLKKLDISCFDTSNVIETVEMFDQCESLTNLDLSNFNTSKVKEMANMFSFCKSLTKLDLSSFDTSNVTRMNGMFYGCNSLVELNLSHFNTFNVTTFYSMFGWCRSLKTLDISNFDVSNVINMTAMFDHCDSLNELDLSNFGLSNVNYISYMFAECKSLKTINLSNFMCPNVNYINYLFGGCDSLETVYASDDNIKKIFYDFKGKLNENTLDFDIIDYGDDENNLIDNDTIKQITVLKVHNFDELKDAVNFKVSVFNQLDTDILDLTDIDVSEITTFYGNEADKYIDETLFSGLDMSNVKYIDITGWDTSNAYSFMCIFVGCENVEEIYGLSDLNVSNLMNLSHTFTGCKSLTSLDFSKWRLKYSLSYIWHAFDGCEQLESIKGLNNFSIKLMDSGSTACLFRNCHRLNNLDISSWDFYWIDDITCIFENCYSLKNLKISLSNKELRDGYAFSHSVNRK